MVALYTVYCRPTPSRLTDKLEYIYSASTAILNVFTLLSIYLSVCLICNQAQQKPSIPIIRQTDNQLVYISGRRLLSLI